STSGLSNSSGSSLVAAAAAPALVATTGALAAPTPARAPCRSAAILALPPGTGVGAGDESDGPGRFAGVKAGGAASRAPTEGSSGGATIGAPTCGGPPRIGGDTGIAPGAGVITGGAPRTGGAAATGERV